MSPPSPGAGKPDQPVLSILSGRHKLWLCDIWGVVHNGIKASKPACDALQRHRAQGGCVVLITNAPRPSSVILPQLANMGAGPECYDAIVSSGDVTRKLVAALAGKTVFHLGPDKDLDLLDGLPVSFSSQDRAEAVLCSGLIDDLHEQPEDYDGLLQDWAGRGLPMICANPDKVVRYGDRLIPCAGALAERYQSMGGQVEMAGKPFAPIYDEAIRLAGETMPGGIAKSDILAIGDGLATDLTGAAEFGLNALFIVNGIHERELAEAGVTEFVARIHRMVPDIQLAGVQSELYWK